MNKFIIVALLAAVCSSAAIAGDYEETKNLPAQFGAFRDFCLSSRDSVLDDLRGNTDSLGMKLFKILFNTVNRDFEPATGNVVSEPTEKAKDAKVDALLDAFKIAFGSRSAAVTAELNQSLDQFKGESLGELEAAFKEACDKATSYDDGNDWRLKEYKENALNNDEKFRGVKVSDLSCATADRVIAVRQGCRIA